MSYYFLYNYLIDFLNLTLLKYFKQSNPWKTIYIYLIASRIFNSINIWILLDEIIKFKSILIFVTIN